uniref:Receptor-like protein kinase At4g00960 n=1 Tax=Rhizophora mucronata TaxID=61149 RepID=A0A2P2J831_RHIMU
MAASKPVYSLCSLLTHFLALTLAQQPAQAQMLYKDCVGKGNYTTNSTYEANLNNLLKSIYTNTDIDYGFYNFSHGESSDKVYAIALCRPDVTPVACRTCIRNASDLLTTSCPNFKEAVGGLDDCMVRYANRYIFGLMEEGPYFWVYSEQNVSDVVGFNRSRMILLDRLRDRAAAGDSRYKRAMDQIAAPNFQTIYALVQCTPDLSESECRDCLYNASGLIPECCKERSGGRVIYPSCNFRYEISRFYNVVSSNAPPPPQPKGRKNITGRIVIIIIVSIVTSIILVICIGVRLKPKKRNEKVEEETEENGIEVADSLQTDFETLKRATDNFDEANKLGQGGFGTVYKGRLPSGQAVAVKRLSKGSGQGELEFKNEILFVAKLQHRNLVRLLGFCFDKEERLIVYEFFSNSSLNKFIFDPMKRALLDWGTRYKIIKGIARGLMYLHEDSRLRIIHRDLKASNILLDDEMNPKISDFGMARLFSVDQTRDETSRLAGTFGYMAPEYVARGHFSAKSDVFSFGVLVLEIVSGQRNSDFHAEEGEEEDLLTYAWRNWNQGRGLKLVDLTMGATKQSEIERCIHIALLCAQANEADRPTMAQVVTTLSSHSITLPLPLEPAFFMQSVSHRSRTTETEDRESKYSNNEVTISDQCPR